MSTVPYDPAAAFPIGAPEGWRADPNLADTERFWDGLHWTDETRPSVRPGTYARTQQALAEGGRSGSRALGGVVQGLLTLCGLLAAALLLYTIIVFNALSVWRLQPTPAAEQEVDKLLLLSTLATWADLGLRTITGILFLVWLGIRYTDTRVDHRVLRRSTGVAIFSWIIPVLQLWWPAQAVKDLWHASRPDAARLGGVGARLPVPSVFFVWWPAWLLAGSGSTAVMTVLAQPQFELTWLIWGTIGTGVQQFATLIAAWALIVIINQVEDHLVADDPTAAFDGNI
ncbi:MAG TPA: DUF4328 domain-containing protein [Dermatophilaceae bacterium]|nr:DUF4328 domain-containing protein [Dermatophilaceae bacterium]